jgi:NAD(P)-dependent dehydrogenase (short-subunit alcohol dehydrogenase family)
VAEALNTHGRIDVVVNNAGKADFAAIEDFTEESFRYPLTDQAFTAVSAPSPRPSTT